MARKSRLSYADVRDIGYDKKARADLVKAIAKAEGVTVRTAQRRITTAGQKRGQTERLSIKTGNTVRDFLKSHPVMDLNASGRTKSEARGNLLVQEIYGSKVDAVTRAEELKQWADGMETQHADLYPGSLFDNVHEIDVIYVPEGSKYSEFDVRYDYEDDEEELTQLTAPSGGVWIVRGIN